MHENIRWLKVLQLHRTARENPGKASQTFPSNKMIDGKPILFSDWIKKIHYAGIFIRNQPDICSKHAFFLSLEKVKNCVENKSDATNNVILSTKMCRFLFEIRFWSQKGIFSHFFTELTELSASFQFKEKVKHGRTETKRHRKAEHKRPQGLKKECDGWHVYGTWSLSQSWQTQAKEKCRLAICSSDDGRNS